MNVQISYFFPVSSGLALAADKDFKTFEAAFPYVVQKLLTENSVATRNILHSVFNALEILINNFQGFTQSIYVDDSDIF